MIAVQPVTEKQQHYTYEDYYSWDDGKRWELIEGVPYAMAPAPSDTHQGISSNLHLQLASFLKGKPCKVFHAAYDVRLNADTGDDTVVQPDLVIICDQSKRYERGCKGAPDMVVEILSKSTASYDMVTKFNLYQKAGVREYWIVDPDTKTVSVHVLKNGEYITRAYSQDDIAPVSVLEGCEINLAKVFEL